MVAAAAAATDGAAAVATVDHHSDLHPVLVRTAGRTKRLEGSLVQDERNRWFPKRLSKSSTTTSFYCQLIERLTTIQEAPNFLTVVQRFIETASCFRPEYVFLRER